MLPEAPVRHGFLCRRLRRSGVCEWKRSGYGRRFTQRDRIGVVGGSVRRLVRLPGACGIGDSVAFFRGTCCNDFQHGLRSVENLSKGGSPGVRRLAAGISTGMRVVGVTVGFRVSADGYRSGFSGARLLGAGLHVFMSGTDIFRFGRSGRRPPASLSRRQIFRPRLHKPGEPPQSIR